MTPFDLIRAHAIRGLTLVELMVTLTIAAVLATLAVPSFREFYLRRATLAAAGALAQDFRLARSEAIKRTNFVTICRSQDGASCAGAGSWHTGWLVFVDSDRDQVVDAGEEVIRTQGIVEGIAEIPATRDAITYRMTGLSAGMGGRMTVTADPSLTDGTRLLCLSMQGRVSVRDPGAEGC